MNFFENVLFFSSLFTIYGSILLGCGFLFWHFILNPYLEELDRGTMIQHYGEKRYYNGNHD